jgi:hypothetical protein
MKPTGTVFAIAMWAMTGIAGAQQYALQPQPAQAPQPGQTPQVVQPRVATTPPAEMKGPSPQGFSVVLVLGDLNTGSSADANVPPAARKALNDMKDFLPYKGYRLLDAEWILGAHVGTTHLRGPDGQDYELTLSNSAAATSTGVKQRVTFRLRESAGDGGDMAMASARNAERSALEQRIRELEREIAAAQKAGERTADATARAQELAAARKRLESETPGATWYVRGRSIIDTTFDMDIGETVVVGTSRLKDTGKDSGRALIALLTAVPKGGVAPKQE